MTVELGSECVCTWIMDCLGSLVSFSSVAGVKRGLGWSWLA